MQVTEIRRFYNKGFTLIELIIVISIIGILAAISIPSFIGYIDKAKESVCRVNCLQLEKSYETYLTMDGLEHSDDLFDQFLEENWKNVCPKHGIITYVDGEIKCSAHTEKEIDDDEDVPWLD